MHLDEERSLNFEKRSPNLIREYFDLLRWKKKDCPVELSPEVIENDESLVLIRDSLAAIQNSIALKRQKMAESQGILSSCETSLPLSKHDLSGIDQELSSVKGERVLVIESSSKLEKISSLVEKTAMPPDRASLKIKEAFKKLVESLDTDLGKVYSNIGIYKYIRNKSNVRISLLVAISVFTFVILIVANVFFSFVLIACLEFYLIQKLFHLNFQHKQTWSKYFTGTEMVSQESEAQEELRARLELKQQELEKKIQILESHKLKTEEHYYRITMQQQQLKEYLHLEQQEIIRLEQVYQQKLVEYDNCIEEIKVRERCIKESRLFSLDAKVQEWLKKDTDRFINKAMKKLKILLPDNSGRQYVQQNETILVLIGVPDKESPSFILEDGNDSNLGSERDKASIPYIHPEDFESEPHFDSRSRRMYGVYEFMAIFLCANFFTYYKCYFNFIRGQTVDEEICEFLYDSVVSIKVQEKSSVRLKDETQKNVYSKRLSLTMKDGKSICFRIARHRLEKNLSIRLSQIDEAAVAIRDMLRQRRVDHTITNNLSDS